MGIYEFDDIQLDVEFTAANSRANLVSQENIAISLGKLAKWYEALVPTGGSSGQILGWNSSGTAKWVSNPGGTDENVKSTKISQSTSAASYYPTLMSGETTAGVGIMDSAKINHTPGTTLAVGNTRLVLGNEITEGTTDNEQGLLRLWSSGTKYHTLSGAKITTEHVEHVLPSTGGTILNTGTTSFTQVLSSGTKIGTIKINGSSSDIYAPAGTSYSAGTGLSLSGTTFNHSNSVTAKTTYDKKYIKYDTEGHVTNSSWIMHSARGTTGSAGWVKIANILITGTYTNEAFKLTISQRGTGLIYSLNIKFSNNETDPTLNRFLSFSDLADVDNGNDAYIIKTATNTWDLYIKKLDPYDLISVTEFDIGQHTVSRITWTWSDVHTNSLPEGGTYVTKKTYLTEETVGYKSITQHSEIDESTGSFVFSGGSAIFNDSGADYVGLQVGYSADEFQLIGSGNSDDNNSLFIRRNDTPNDSTGWTSWSRLLTPGAIGSSTAITVTPTTVTKGDYTISNGVTIAHSDVTSTSSTASKTLDYGESFNAISAVTVNAQGHVTAKTTSTYTLPALSHISITKQNDSTSTASPSAGGTFTAVDSVTRDTYGHVLKINTKTVTLPNDSDEKVKQTNATDNTNRPLLLSYYNNDSSTDTTTPRIAYRNINIYANPSEKALYARFFKTTETTCGLIGMDSTGTSYGLAYDNGTNLWIGTTQSTSRHHKGEVMISSGWSGALDNTFSANSSIKVSVPTYNTSTEAWGHNAYLVLHSGNYTTTGDGNAITSVSFTNEKLTFTKGDTFTKKQVAAVGSDTAGSNGWYKVVDGSLSGTGNTTLKFSVQCSSSGASGILYLNIRANSSVLVVKKFGWLVHDGYNTDHFIMNIDGTSWTIYQYISRTQYYRDFWTVITESGTNSKTTSFTLYDTRTPESSSPVTESSVYSDDYNDIFPYSVTNPSDATSYGITFHTSVTGSTSDPSTRQYLRTNDGIKYYTREGTTSKIGYGYIVLGNKIPTGTNGNKCGAVRCYTTGNEEYVQLSGSKDASSMRFSHSSGTAGNFSPSTDNIYDLGTSTERWKNIYASGSISGANGTFSSALTVNGTASVNGINLYNPTTQMYINLLAPANLNSAYDITFPKKSGTVALTSDITGLNGGDTYTPIYMNNGVPTTISSLNDDGGWLVYNGGSTGVDARLVTNRTIGHWNGRVGSAAGVSNLCYFGCSDLDTGFAGDLLSVGGAIFSTNSYFSNSTQKFTGIQIGDTRNGYRKMQLVTAGGSSGRIYARYSTADNPTASNWSDPVALLQTGDITAGPGIHLTPSQVIFGDEIITKGYSIDLKFDVETSGSGNVVTGISFLDDTLTVTKGTAPTGSGGSASQPVYINSSGTVTAVAQPESGAWYPSTGAVPCIKSYTVSGTTYDGVMKVGKYIDFHASATTLNDYDIRLSSSTNTLSVQASGLAPHLALFGTESHLRFTSLNSDGSSLYSSNYNGITAYAADANGLNMTLQSGGNLIIGGGEYPTNFYGATKSVYDYWDGTAGEKTYIGSDGHIVFHTNGGTIANRKTFMFSGNGHLYMPPSGNINFWYGTANSTYHTLKPTTGTTARTWTLPNKTGTIALTSDIPSVPSVSASRQYATGVNIGSITIDGTETTYIVPKGTSSQTGAVTVSDSYSSSDGSASSSVAASSYAVNQVYQIANAKSTIKRKTYSYTPSSWSLFSGATSVWYTNLKLSTSVGLTYSQIISVNMDSVTSNGNYSYTTRLRDNGNLQIVAQSSSTTKPSGQTFALAFFYIE